MKNIFFNQKRYFYLIILLFLHNLIISCSGTMKSEDYSEQTTINKSTAEEYEELKVSNDEAVLAAPTDDKTASKDDAGTVPGNDGEVEEKVENKIIKTANLSFELKDYDKKRYLIDTFSAKWKGYISQENEVRNMYRITNNICLRVSNENFDSLVNSLLSIATRIDSKVISANDVTAEYVDAKARLKSKKEIELQYVELLKKSNTVNDILNVTQYLRQIREEIEAKEGQLKYIDDQVSMSTINLYVYQDIQQSEIRREGFFSKVLESLKMGWNGILYFILGITTIWPIILLVVAMIVVIRKLRKNAKLRKLN